MNKQSKYCRNCGNPMVIFKALGEDPTGKISGETFLMYCSAYWGSCSMAKVILILGEYD